MPPRKGESSSSTVRSPARAAVMAAAVPAEPPPTTTRSASSTIGRRSSGTVRVARAISYTAGADHLVPELREGVGRRHLAPEAAGQEMEPLGESGHRIEAPA